MPVPHHIERGSWAIPRPPGHRFLLHPTTPTPRLEPFTRTAEGGRILLTNVFVVCNEPGQLPRPPCSELDIALKNWV